LWLRLAAGFSRWTGFAMFAILALVARFSVFTIFATFACIIEFSGGTVFGVFAVLAIIPTSAFIREGRRCHIPGLVESTGSAMGESHLEFLGELTS
jgi:hypothetical protein